MSIQWSLIASFLYGEIIVVTMLMIPCVSPKRWNKLFQSGFLKSLAAQSKVNFVAIIGVLGLVFVNSVRQTMRFSTMRLHEIEHAHLDAEVHQSMKMFRAERNFYIAGFALYMWLVLHSLVRLISLQARLMDNCDTSTKQAQNDTEEASKTLKGLKFNECHRVTEIQELNKRLEDVSKELKNAIKEKNAIKTQAESLAKRLDNLCKEHAKCNNSFSSSKDE